MQVSELYLNRPRNTTQWLFTFFFLFRSVRLENSEREDIVYHLGKNPISSFEKFPYGQNVFHFFTQNAWRLAVKTKIVEVLGTGVKSEKRLNGTRRCIRNVPTGKTGLPFQMIRVHFGNFPVSGWTQKTFSIYVPTEISAEFSFRW